MNSGKSRHLMLAMQRQDSLEKIIILMNQITENLEKLVEEFKKVKKDIESGNMNWSEDV